MDFLTTVKGPGTVWLQSMPIAKLAGLLYMGEILPVDS